MELCSGRQSPIRKRKMCKTTTVPPAGIPVTVSRPSVVPSIENWYVVARKKSTGTCSIYSSWADYKAEYKQPKSSLELEDEESPEIAAFPTMVQVLGYIKIKGNQSPESMRSSPLAQSSKPTVDTTTIISGRTIPSKSSTLRKTDGGATSPSSTDSHPKRRIYKRAMETIRVIDEEVTSIATSISDCDDRSATASATERPA